MIPEFDADGNLSAGIHDCTWRELTQRFGKGPHRQRLLKGLKAALDSLKAAGCQTVFVNGSFVTAKSVPGDFDACWDLKGVDPQRLDPVLLKFDDGRIAQRTKYGGELFPAQFSEGVTGKRFMEFFQVDKQTGKAKGIIVLDLRSLP